MGGKRWHFTHFYCTASRTPKHMACVSEHWSPLNRSFLILSPEKGKGWPARVVLGVRDRPLSTGETMGLEVESGREA